MNRNALIAVAVIVVICIAGVVFLSMRGTTPPQTPQVQTPKAEPKPAPPPPLPAPKIEQPATPAAPPPPPPVAEKPRLSTPAILTEEALKESEWKQGEISMRFGSDGNWYVMGNPAPRSKWKVEGKRVKLYDDKGEVHYLEIDGNTLKFKEESSDGTSRLVDVQRTK